MNPFLTRRAPHEQTALDAFNDGIKRARNEHLNQTTCHRCGTLLDLITGRVTRVCGDCRKDKT